MLASLSKAIVTLLGGFTVIFVSISLVESSPRTSRIVESQNNSEKDLVQLKPELLFQIKVHALLLWSSVGFLMPIGIIIIRISKRVQSRNRLKALYYLHLFFQITAVLSATAGAILSLTHFQNSFDNSHQKIGLALHVLIWIQPLIACFRPRRGMKKRSLWYFAHWLLGTTTCVLGITNVYIGLHAYHQRTSRNVRLWTVLFTVEIVIFAFIYLFQDRWDYMMNQEKIIGDEQVRPASQASPNDNNKELSKISTKKHQTLQDFFCRL